MARDVGEMRRMAVILVLGVGCGAGGAATPGATEADAHFSTRPDGLPGNDDPGATSAWRVLAMMGLYTAAPGDATSRLSTSLLERVVLGRVFPVLSVGCLMRS